MRQKISVVIGVMFIAALVVGTAFGWMGCDKQGQGDSCHKGKMEAIAKELNLTADQEKQLKSAKEDYRTQLANLRLALKEKRQVLQGELSKPDVTRQEVEPIVAEIKGLESTMVEQRVDGIFKIKEILTPEQFGKLQAKKEERWKAGKMRHGRKEWQP